MLSTTVSGRLKPDIFAETAPARESQNLICQTVSD